MLEEAHEAAQDTRTSTLAFVGGFVLFALVSAGLETALGTDGGSDGENRPAGPRQSMMTSVSHLAVPTLSREVGSGGLVPDSMSDLLPYIGP